MIEFYSIAENNNSKHKYQLNDLGDTFISAIIGSRTREMWGESKNSSQTFFRKPTKDDYDRQFANTIRDHRPPYEIEFLLNHHFEFYLKNNPKNKNTFFNHLQYVILPILKTYNNPDVQIELINKWLNNNMGKKDKENVSLNFGDINSPTQFQINSNSSTQKQTIQYSNEEVSEFLKLMKEDLDNLNSDQRKELAYEIHNTEKNLNKGKDIKNRLLIIGEIIKDIGVGTFTNLLSSPIYEIFKPHIGL